jgi:hypothetical protein
MHISFGTVPFRFGAFIAKHRGHRAIAVKKALLSERPTPGQSSFKFPGRACLCQVLKDLFGYSFITAMAGNAMFAVDVSELQSKCE